MWCSMIDIYALEKIKRITRKWKLEQKELNEDQLNKMLEDIWKLVK